MLVELMSSCDRVDRRVNVFHGYALATNNDNESPTMMVAHEPRREIEPLYLVMEDVMKHLGTSGVCISCIREARKHFLFFVT